MLAEARCDGFVCAHRHGKIEVVVHLGLDSHHWLLVTEPPRGVRVGGWHLLPRRYDLETPPQSASHKIGLVVPFPAYGFALWLRIMKSKQSKQSKQRLLQRGMVLPVMLGDVAQQQHFRPKDNDARNVVGPTWPVEVVCPVALLLINVTVHRLLH